MRPDMFKVIVERPRCIGPRKAGSLYPRGSLKSQALREGDCPRRMEPLGRRRYGWKHLNENLAPLERFLRARVGLPWSKVHSEICAQLSPGSAVQQHVLDHLRGFVTVRTWLEDGVLFGADASGAPRRLESARRGQFYRCPTTGLLRMVPVPPRRRLLPRSRPEDRPDPRVLFTQLRRLEGTWYRLGLAPLGEPSPTQAPDVDRVLGRAVTAADVAVLHKLYGRSHVFAATRARLTAQELRARGLEG